MAIKDDIDSIKTDLSTEEQFLENAIKSERFFKKYKKFFIIALIVGVVGGIYYYATEYINEQNFKVANAAYSGLLANPKDDKLKNELKSKDVNLYALFAFRQSLENNNTNALNELLNENIDPLLKEIIKSQTGQNGEILSNYKSLLKAYELIKENKIEQAGTELKKIPLNSPLQPIVKNLRHYQGNAK
ncbi:MAG: hypothetical protein ACTTJC_07965 [Campylobacter sp.]